MDFITVNHDKLSMKAKVGVANLVVSTVHQVGAHFEALAEGLLATPLDSRYSTLRLDSISSLFKCAELNPNHTHELSQVNNPDVP